MQKYSGTRGSSANWKLAQVPKRIAKYVLGWIRKFDNSFFVSELEAYFQEESRKVIESGSNLLKIWYGPIMRIYPLDSDAVKVSIKVVI